MSSDIEIEIIDLAPLDKLPKGAMIDTEHAYIVVTSKIADDDMAGQPTSYNKKYYQENKARLQEKYKTR